MWTWLDQCPAAFSCLEELMPVLCLMELDLTSLKGTTVLSSSRFWGVYESVCLWTVLPTLTVLDTSISAAAFKQPSQHIFTATSPVLDPGVIAGASVSWSCRLKLARWELMWIFPRFPNPVLCIVESYIGFPQPPELALCGLGLLSTCFSSAGLPSILWDLCALLLAHQTTYSAPRVSCGLQRFV